MLDFPNHHLNDFLDFSVIFFFLQLKQHKDTRLIITKQIVQIVNPNDELVLSTRTCSLLTAYQSDPIFSKLRFLTRDKLSVNRFFCFSIIGMPIEREVL